MAQVLLLSLLQVHVLRAVGCPVVEWFLFQCVIIEARAVQDVEGAMEAVNAFVKTAPTFIAKVQVTITSFALDTDGHDVRRESLS